MIAVESKQNEVVSDVQMTKPVFFASAMGVSFQDDNSVAKNKALLDFLKKVPVDDIVKEQNLTSFSINHADLGYFLHSVYCLTPEGKNLQVDFDGIWPFEAKDERGDTQQFNAQLVTIRELPVQ